MAVGYHNHSHELSHYDGKPAPSLPLIDTLQERRDLWLLKKYGLPRFYWKLMLRGRA